MKMMKRILLLCLCLAMLAGSAPAEEMVNIGRDGYDGLWYRCTLPDGRAVFSGYRAEPGQFWKGNAVLLCLNPDGSVSWEYADPQRGSYVFTDAAVTKDGRIVTCFQENQGNDTMRFFTADGQPDGQAIPQNYLFRYFYLPSGVFKQDCMADNPVPYSEFVDWNGNRVFRIDGDLPIWVLDAVEEEDGLVLSGREDTDFGVARILKVDWQGNTVWDNALPYHLEHSDGSLLQGTVKMSCGGYLARLEETAPDSQGVWEHFDALVRFSSEGRLLWTNEEICRRWPDASMCESFTEYKGRYVVQYEADHEGNASECGIRFLWLDADGKELGVTETRLNRENCAPLAEGKQVYAANVDSFFTMGDGLWATCGVEKKDPNEQKEWANADVLLIKVPEL